MSALRPMLREIADGALDLFGDLYKLPKKAWTVKATRDTTMDRFATVFKRPDPGMDLMSEVERTRDWSRIEDAIFEFQKKMDPHGKYDPFTKRAIIRPDVDVASAGTHEVAHHLYSGVFTPEKRKIWDKAVKEYGKPIFDTPPTAAKGLLVIREKHKESLTALRGHPTLGQRKHYRDQVADKVGERVAIGLPSESVTMNVEHYIANTESLAFTIQDILTPGEKITAPLGMLRAIEKLFDTPGLVDRVAHRIEWPRFEFPELDEAARWAMRKRPGFETETKRVAKELDKLFKATANKRLTLPKSKPPSRRVVRVEEPGVKTGLPSSKPHGLYTTPEEFFDPNLREELTGIKTVFTRHDKNPLDVSGDIWESHARFGDFGRMQRGPVSAGIKALKALLEVHAPPGEFKRLMQLSKKDLQAELIVAFPSIKWDRYYDSYEMLEGLAGTLAKKFGYDSIVDIDKVSPAFSEIIFLTDAALALKPVKPTFPRPVGLRP